MHELTGKIANVSFSMDGKPLVTLEMNERNSTLEMVDDLKSLDKLTVKIGKFKVKRSLDANAYAWVLIGKIAEKTNVPKNEVYQEAIRNIGGNYEIVCITKEAAPSLIKLWESRGLGWQTEVMYSKLKGCINVLLYYGSSCYDTEQMSVLISNLQQDCSNLDIEVRPQEEIDSLLNSWGGMK